MQKEEFIKLALKYAKNKCSLSEREVVETFYLKQTEREQNTIIFSMTEEKRKAILQKIDLEINKPKEKLRSLYFKMIQIAAIAIIVLAIPLIIIQSTSKSLLTRSAAKGEIKTLFLPDGSQLILNANSSVTYSNDFKDNRNLVLKGEAYFKVVRNPKSPFTIETPQFTTQVLGTSFTIKAYDNYPNTISVISGKVKVNSMENPNQNIFLIKNQQVLFQKSHTPQLSNNSSEDFLAWTKNIVVLKNTSLGEAAEILRNKFNVTIIFDNPELQKLRISGKFKDETLNTILSTIAEVKQLKIHFQTPNKIYIREN